MNKSDIVNLGAIRGSATVAIKLKRRDMLALARKVRGRFSRDEIKDAIIEALTGNHHTERRDITAVAALLMSYVVEHPQAETHLKLSNFLIEITDLPGKDNYNFRLMASDDETFFTTAVEAARLDSGILDDHPMILRGR
jgi:hypothetical protein